jgi:hypothetical protein
MPSYGSFHQSKDRASTATEAQTRAPFRRGTSSTTSSLHNIYTENTMFAPRTVSSLVRRLPLRAKLLSNRSFSVAVSQCVSSQTTMSMQASRPQRSPKRPYVELANAIDLHRWKMGSQTRREETTIALIRRCITPHPSHSKDILTTTASSILDTPQEQLLITPLSLKSLLGNRYQIPRRPTTPRCRTRNRPHRSRTSDRSRTSRDLGKDAGN